MTDERTSILQMARGAIQERVDYEMEGIIANIMDPNTDAGAKRKLTLQIEFVPDAERQLISVRCTATSKLAPTMPVATTLWMSGSDATGELVAVEMVPNVPGQTDIFGGQQEEPPVLRIVRNA